MNCATSYATCTLPHSEQPDVVTRDLRHIYLRERPAYRLGNDFSHITLSWVRPSSSVW